MTLRAQSIQAYYGGVGGVGGVIPSLDIALLSRALSRVSRGRLSFRLHCYTEFYYKLPKFCFVSFASFHK